MILRKESEQMRPQLCIKTYMYMYQITYMSNTTPVKENHSLIIHCSYLLHNFLQKANGKEMVGQVAFSESESSIRISPLLNIF